VQRGGFAAEGDVAAEGGEFGIVAGEEEIFTDKARTLLIPYPAAATAAGVVGLVASLG
jgi:hypothetical protein